MNNFKLDTHPKITSGFIIPENYFETLEANIQNKLATDAPKVISLKSRILNNKTWFTSVAAALVISISLLLYVNYQNQNQHQYTAELENYITNHPNYSDDEIVNLLETDQIANIKFNLELNKTAIENQLLDNIDIEEIITN